MVHASLDTSAQDCLHPSYGPESHKCVFLNGRLLQSRSVVFIELLEMQPLALH